MSNKKDSNNSDKLDIFIGRVDRNLQDQLIKESKRLVDRAKERIKNSNNIINKGND